MIVERRRGALSTPGGTLERLAVQGLPEKMERRFLSLSNTMLRLGAAGPSRTEGQTVGSRSKACGAAHPEAEIRRAR